MNNEIKLSTKAKKILAVALLGPLILSIIAIYLIFGDPGVAIHKMWELRGKPNVTGTSITSLSYIFTILVAIYALIATIFFSYQVWKVSENNLLVSKQIQNLESNRDKEIVKENALIVYYDLQRGITNLRDLYVSCCIKQELPSPSRIYFSDDWIKNVANLRIGLSNHELNEIYKIYEQFFSLQSMLDEYKLDSQNDTFKRYLKKFSSEIFANFIKLPLLEELKVTAVDELVNIDLFLILQKIYSLTYGPELEIRENRINGECFFETIVNDIPLFIGKTQKPFEGIGKLYSTKGKLKSSGNFQLGQFKSGKVYGYYDSERICYEITYQDTPEGKSINYCTLYKMNTNEDIPYYYNGEVHNDEIENGFTTIFNRNGKLMYQGEIENSEYSGFGISYSSKGQLTYRGMHNEGYRIEGTGYIKGKEYFTGTFSLGRPWTGKIKNYNFSEEVKNFTGEIFEGKPINGVGYYFKKNSQGEDLEDLRARREWEEEVHEAEYDDDDRHEVEMEMQQEYINNEIRREYSIWSNYIRADWNEGTVNELDDKEINIRVYYVEGSKIKE